MGYNPEIQQLRERPMRDVWVRRNSGRDLIDCVNAYYAEGRKIKLPDGVFTIDETLRPVGDRSDETGNVGSLEGVIEGSGFNKSIIKAGAGITPLVAFDHYTGHDTYAQSGPQMRDLTLDANTEDDCLLLDNVKHGIFERIQYKNWDRYAQHLTGHTDAGGASGHSYWNKFFNSKFYSTIGTAAICNERYSIDSEWDTMWGTATGAIGFLVNGDGGHTVRDLWLVDVLNEVKLYATDDDIYDCKFDLIKSDKATGANFYLKLNNKSITRCVFDRPHVFRPDLGLSTFLFEGFAAKAFLKIVIDGGDDDSNAASRYNFEYDNVGAMTTCRFYNPNFTTGGLGQQLNIPAGTIIVDA